MAGVHLNHDPNPRLTCLWPLVGARFTCAFKEVGIEKVSDLKQLHSAEREELSDALKQAGARSVQLRRIIEEIDKLHTGETNIAETLRSKPETQSAKPPEMQPVKASYQWDTFVSHCKRVSCKSGHHHLTTGMITGGLLGR